MMLLVLKFNIPQCLISTIEAIIIVDKCLSRLCFQPEATSYKYIYFNPALKLVAEKGKAGWKWIKLSHFFP